MRANGAGARRRLRRRQSGPCRWPRRRAAAVAGGDGETMGRLLRAARLPPLLLLLAWGEYAPAGGRRRGPGGVWRAAVLDSSRLPTKDPCGAAARSAWAAARSVRYISSRRQWGAWGHCVCLRCERFHA